MFVCSHMNVHIDYESTSQWRNGYWPQQKTKSSLVWDQMLATCCLSSVTELTYVKDSCILIAWFDFISPELWASINLVFGSKKGTFTFIRTPTFPLLTAFFKGLLQSLWQIPSPLAFRPACLSVLQHTDTCGFVSFGDRFEMKLLLLEAPKLLLLRSQEKLQGCCCRGLLFLILGSFFQDLCL